MTFSGDMHRLENTLIPLEAVILSLKGYVTMYTIQAKSARGWTDITTHADESEAKRMAKLLSVENNVPHRVVEIIDGQERPIIAYDWGQPYAEINGVDTVIPSYYESLTDEDEDNDTPLVFYAVESRLNPVLNELRYTAWSRHSLRRFVDYRDAEDEARTLSIQHPDRDFRIVYWDIDNIPCILWRGGVKYAQLGDAPVAEPEKRLGNL